MDEQLKIKLLRKVETKNQDYKRSESWDKAKNKITKDILAMSNIRDGGDIIIGVKENETTGQFELGGVDKSILKTYETTKVSVYVNSHASLPVTLEVRIEEYENNDYVFIKVKEFDDIPIICKKDSKDGELTAGHIYIRTNAAQSVPITAPGINNAEEMRNLIDLAITKRGDRLLEQIRTIVNSEYEKREYKERKSRADAMIEALGKLKKDLK